ncbi:Cys/Met metabolism pyridoxal-phosphate-dependent protein [Xanthobacter versatilis]|uniref:Cys/Met metabolism pyridoxal-phosphate-dependent protein n=1 Tax=Xanthobacter autotrophicus (strain ATCC BAA-1158 / Py2) TaxID=78245 RepID=A7ING0_XANP2|nr:Cys/Met metabolism pyridoxal-phosphate-dependent protein [Xanthobacter autotrophicus Py2]
MPPGLPAPNAHRHLLSPATCPPSRPPANRPHQRIATSSVGQAPGTCLGPALSPFNAFLILTGIETLGLRMQRHSENALKVAEYLAAHPKVEWVSYPGLASDRYHALAKQYLPKGAGAVFTFGLKGGYEAGVKLVSSVELFSHLANIGDTRSLIIHPASTTHRQLTDEAKVVAGAGPQVVRLSVGIEDVADIIGDLEQALAKV